MREGPFDVQKWLEVHGIEHWTHFYTDYGVDLQEKFFGHFLRGEDTGWARQPPVLLQVHHPGERFVERHESEWPLARTRWTPLYLDPAGCALVREPPPRESRVSYAGLGDGVTFLVPARTLQRFPLRSPNTVIRSSRPRRRSARIGLLSLSGRTGLPTSGRLRTTIA